MDIVKLYQVDDLIAAYLKSWGYQDEGLVLDIFKEMRKQYAGQITPQDIISFLDGCVLNHLEDKWAVSLPSIEKLNYFKMIFLLNEGAKKCVLFKKLSPKEETFLQTLFENEKYLIAPDIIPANMFRQSIRTFHPVWKLKKAVVKGVQKIVPNTKNKKRKI